MNILRGAASLIIFITGAFLIIEFASSEPNWIYLAISLGCFILAYFLWPSSKRGQRHNDNVFIDLLEIIIELPVEIVMWLFRRLIGLSKKSDCDIDLGL